MNPSFPFLKLSSFVLCAFFDVGIPPQSLSLGRPCPSCPFELFKYWVWPKPQAHTKMCSFPKFLPKFLCLLALLLFGQKNGILGK